MGYEFDPLDSDLFTINASSGQIRVKTQDPDATKFEDTEVSIRVLDNDSDPEDEQRELMLSVFNSGDNAPLNGTVTVNEPPNVGANRTITYEPNDNYHGRDRHADAHRHGYRH